MSAGVTPQTPSVLVFNDTDDFNAAVLNAAFSSLDLRTRAIEALSVSYQDAVDTLNQFGLARLNDALQPVYDSLVTLTQLGAVFTSTSATPATAALGLHSFVLPEADRGRFAAAATLGAQSTDGSNIAMFGTLSSYDRASGTLVINVTQFTGTGSASAWQISAASLANFSATADSIGTYTKNQIDQAIATSQSSVTSALLGGVSSNGNTLAKLYALLSNNGTLIQTLTTQLQGDEATIAAHTTALANRLRIDGAGGYTAAQKLQGSQNLGVPYATTVTKSAATTVTAADVGTLYVCTGTWPLTLPSASAVGAGFQIEVANAGTGKITLTPAGSDTIRASASLVVNGREGGILVSDGTNWQAVGFTPVIIATSASAGGGMIRWSNGYCKQWGTASGESNITFGLTYSSIPALTVNLVGAETGTSRIETVQVSSVQTTFFAVRPRYITQGGAVTADTANYNWVSEGFI